MTDGSDEVRLTDESIRLLTGGRRIHERHIPPHVEMAGRIHAMTTEALECGDYVVVVFPARAGGTLTARFTPLLSGSGLEDAYRSLPVGTDGAMAAQLSFPPAYSHADNVCREPRYLPDVLGLGEHRVPEDHGGLSVDDLAITATRERLHLVSISLQRVVEPQVFHALALDKQAPALARFLAALPRAFRAQWHAFDWGPHAARLPYLPRVRYRRSILSLARWRLTSADVPAMKASHSVWRRALDTWRRRWRCPDVVDLRDADRTLRLALDEPAHTALLRAHLDREDEAILAEAPTASELGWIEGHAHEIAVPLVTTRPRASSPLRGALPRATNGGHGGLPGSPQAVWLNARIHTHPERQDEILAQRLGALLSVFDDTPAWWFVRYRNARETDHLRLRIATPSREHHAVAVGAVGSWAQCLRQDGLIGRLALDAYYPEIGRYGHGPAIEAAEAVFVADSEVVAAAMRCPSGDPVHAAALVVAGMLDIAAGVLGDEHAALRWLADRPVPAGDGLDRAVADQTIRLAAHVQDLPGWTGEVEEGWQARAAALASYRALLPPSIDVDGVVESLLHMHHNRAVGIDLDNEHVCRRLTRRLAQARLARLGELYR